MGDIHSFGQVDPSARVFDPHLSIFLAEQMIHVGAHSRIDGGVRIEGGMGVSIGAHVHISTGCKVIGGGYFEIGDHSGLSDDVIVATGMPDLKFKHISAADASKDRHSLRLRTIIGKYVCVFAGARIAPGVTIGHCAVIGMGAVVTKPVGDYEVWWGNPATFQYRRKGLL